MNASLISVSSLQKTLAILAILALVFGPFSKVFTAHAVGLDCSVSVVSDDTNTVTEKEGSNAVLSWVHPGWTASIDGAQWIWGTYQVEDTTVVTTETFVKTFNWNGPVTDATLEIASDNGYVVTVNGHEEANITDENNFTTGTQDTVIIPAADILQGSNTLEIVVTNDATLDHADPTYNPAGLLYKLTVSGTNLNCATLPSSSITVVKNFDGDAPSEWSFDFDSSFGPFALSNGNNSTTTKLLDSGTYTISESLDTNTWDTPSVNCSDESTGENGQVTVDLGLEQNVTCTFTNHQKEIEIPAPECIGENLLSNASFEEPVVTDGSSAYGGFYEAFASIPSWISSSVDGFEVWNNMFGGASNGAQNLELDVNTPTGVSQVVPTVVGNMYKVSYDFAARPDTDEANNELNVVIDGSVVDTVSADGTSDSSINWGSHYYEFTAATTSTKIEFSDQGTSDGSGTLLDNTSVCLTQDNVVTTYHIYGQVWNDLNSSDEKDEGEDALAGKTIHITNGETTFSTTTDSDGDYYFDIPAGTWTITENAGEQWDITYPNDGSYTVTVPTIVAEAQHQSIFASIMDAIVPTAYAAILPPGFGPFNFGNVFVGGSSTTQSGGGNGKRIELTDDNSDGQVLGASTSTDPVVVTPVVIPVGAPNTGAGGTSALVISLPTLNAVMFERRKLRSIKNG